MTAAASEVRRWQLAEKQATQGGPEQKAAREAKREAWRKRAVAKREYREAEAEVEELTELVSTAGLSLGRPVVLKDCAKMKGF